VAPPAAVDERVSADGPPVPADARGGAVRRWAAAGGSHLASHVAVGLATALTFSLCLYDLASRSLWLDEANRVVVAQQRGLAFWHAIAGDGGNQTVYYMLLRVVTTVFGSTPFVVRFPSAVAAALTVPVAAMLVRRLYDDRAAAVGAFAVGVSLPLIYWGQSSDGYALGVLFATLSCWAFVRWLDGERLGAAVWVVTTTLMLYTLLLTGFVVVAQAVALLALVVDTDRRRTTSWRSLLLGAGVVAVLAIPLALLAHAHGTADINWLVRPNKSLEHDAVRAFASAGNQPEFPPITGTSTLLLQITLVLWLVGALSVVWRLVRRGAAGPVFAPLFLVSWLVVPVALSFLVSVTYQPVFITRYLLASLPAGSLLAAVAVTRVRPALLGVAGGVALVVLRFMQIPDAYGKPLEDWRSPTAYVLAHTQPGDCIAFFALDGRMPFEYYLRQGPAPALLPTPVLPVLPWSDNPVEVEVYTPIAPAAYPGILASCTRLFLVASHQGSPTGTPRQRVTHRDYLHMLGVLRGYYPDLTLARFGPITVFTYAKAAGAG
jgi:mannosyltransferase